MDQASAQQFAEQVTHAARCLEVVDICLAVGVNPHQTRRDRRKVGEVVPVEGNARSGGHGDQVHRVVGCTTGSQQAHHGVNNRTLINLLVKRAVVAAGFGVANRLLGGIARQCFAHFGAWVHKRSTGQV